MNPLKPTPPRSEIEHPREKCISIMQTPAGISITHLHASFPKHYNLRMPRAQWRELVARIEAGESAFVLHLTPEIARIHGLSSASQGEAAKG